VPATSSTAELPNSIVTPASTVRVAPCCTMVPVLV
jgi:hypothetical protein